MQFREKCRQYNYIIVELIKAIENGVILENFQNIVILAGENLLGIKEKEEKSDILANKQKNQKDNTKK